MSDMSYSEKDAMARKERTKEINYKMGATKRKLNISPSDKVEPGTLIRKANESKLSRRDVAIRGLI